MALDFKKLRTYRTFESCELACMRSNQHRDPILLKNGKWAAMTINEQFEYVRLRSGIAVNAKQFSDEVAKINKAAKEYRNAKNNRE